MDNIQPITYVVISIVFAIGTSSFLGRWYSRILVVSAFGVDDAFSIFLFLVNILQQSILYLFLHYGCGRHQATLSNDDLTQITKWLFYEEIFYMFAHLVIKQTFLMFYLRLTPNHRFRRFVYAVMILSAAFTLVNWLLAFLQCIPFDAIFHPELYPNATCMNKYVVLMTPSVLNIVSDVIILLMPITTIWSLQMSKRRKIAVITIVGFGASAVIVAMCRFIVLYELGQSSDTPYVLGKMVIVAAVEIQCAIVAVNLPSLKPLWTKITGGSTNDRLYGKEGSNGKGYMMSSMKHSGKVGKAGPVADIHTGNHVATVFASESAEKLWTDETRSNVHVTKSINISHSARSDTSDPRDESR